MRVNFRNFHTVESTGSSSREETNITSLMLEKQIKHKRRFLREKLFDEKTLQITYIIHMLQAKLDRQRQRSLICSVFI